MCEFYTHYLCSIYFYKKSELYIYNRFPTYLRKVRMGLKYFYIFTSNSSICIYIYIYIYRSFLLRKWGMCFGVQNDDPP